MKTPRLVAAAMASFLTIGSVLLAAPPAQASVSSPTIDITKVQWIPGSGNVRVTAWARCDRSMSDASWSIYVGQEHGAGATSKLRCDGKRHNISMVLSPKKGRFHPGHAAMSWSAKGCTPKVCAAFYADGSTTIHRPGKARGPRSHR